MVHCRDSMERLRTLEYRGASVCLKVISNLRQWRNRILRWVTGKRGRTVEASYTYLYRSPAGSITKLHTQSWRSATCCFITFGLLRKQV
ncbi:hypothetical protein EV363DRAFT_1439958 [Boletus edulis]|nr:hypothetical protein EV363DRAFT_1439958 [Boletus edulis]